jgi:hypothetical protein
MWSITARPDDVTPPQMGYPDIKDFEKRVDAVKYLLSSRTGYNLVARPASIGGIYPVGEKAKAIRDDLLDRIRTATAAGQINLDTDTGFDIDPQSK